MTGFRNNHFHVLIKRFGYNFHYDFFWGFKLWLWVSIWFWVRLEKSLMFFMVLNIVVYGFEYDFLWVWICFFGFDLVWEDSGRTWWDGGCLSKPYRKPYLSENQKTHIQIAKINKNGKRI